MKALTVKQPWAWAIACGAKDIENRTWNTNHLGRLAIHAAARDDHASAFARIYELTGAYVLRTDRSAVVAVVDVAGVCTEQDGCACGPWAIPDQHHWRLINARALPNPVSCKGRLGLWNLPADVEAAVLEQLAEVSR